MFEVVNAQRLHAFEVQAALRKQANHRYAKEILSTSKRRFFPRVGSMLIRLGSLMIDDCDANEALVIKKQPAGHRA